MKIRYFDNAATTRIKEEVLKKMTPFLNENYGNASAMYGIGRICKKAIEEARGNVAELLGAKSNEIYFTSGGSESDNWALKGFAYANRQNGNHIITSKIEHHAILESCETLERQGYQITYLDVDKKGFIDLNELLNSITNETILISIMFANNEIGTIQKINQISQIAHRYNIVFHTDAVQAVGNIPIDVERMGIDMLSMSSHKLYGPKGIGALYIRKGIQIEKYMNGGHQEKSMRAGTENVAGIVGFGEACRLAKRDMESHIRRLKNLRDYFVDRIQTITSNFKINGDIENRLPGNINVSFTGQDAETVLMKLDEKGICASAGSACNTGDTKPSHVLMAIGMTVEDANASLRFTFGDENTKDDVDYLVRAINEIINE